MMTTMISGLSVCNVGILWTNGRLFQLLPCWALIYRPGSAYVGQFLPLLLLPHAAQNRGGNCTFNLLPTTSVRLWHWCVLV